MSTNLFSGLFGATAGSGGTGLTADQLAKLNGLPTFAPRKTITVAGVQGVAAVAEATAEGQIDLDLSAINARVRFVATAAGAASNGIRVKLETTSVASQFDTLWPEVGSENRDWSIRINAARAHTINEIAQIIAISPLNPPFTLIAVDSIHSTISFPNTNFITLEGGADEVEGVAHVDEVSETHQPIDGEALVFSGANGVVNKARYETELIGTSNVDFLSDRVAADLGIAIADLKEWNLINGGQASTSGTHHKGEWHSVYKRDLEESTPVNVGDSLSWTENGGLLFFGIIGTDTQQQTQFFLGKLANGNIAVSASETYSDQNDLFNFEIRGIL